MYVEATANARLVLAACERAGVPQARVLRAAGVAPGKVQPPALHLPWPEMERLLVAAEQLTGDACIGLRAGAAVNVTHWGLVGQYIINQPTIRAADELGYLRVQPTWCTVVRCEFVRAPGSTALRVTEAARGPAVRHVVDYHLMFAIVGLRTATRRDWHPPLTRLRLPQPACAAVYERLVGGSLDYSAPVNELWIEDEVFDQPIDTYDPALEPILRPYLDAHLAAMRDDLALTLWTRERLAQQLHAGQAPSLRQTAKGLPISVRTLQARLKAEGTSFRDVLDTLRRELAQVALHDSPAPVEAVAARLGFADAAALVRAFRRWTGTTPAEWRRAAETAARPAPRTPA